MKHSLGFIALLMLLAAMGSGARPAQAAEAFTLTADTPWVVAPDQPEPIARALEDVKADWYKVLGHMPIVLAEPPADYAGPLVYLGQGGEWLKGALPEPPAGRESFILALREAAPGRPVLVAAGADVRGTIYAAYALSEELLGVDPWYTWTDHEPQPRASVPVPAGYEKRFDPPTFKWRGWFINDEDLLNDFAPDPLRENVFSLEMFDRIYETLLRVRGNMVVPATFAFPDERAQELAARRGLALNMHHIQVVGLNTYRWPEGEVFSYERNPALMERYWQDCIDAFKNFETVWTVGYRGKHDRPFWVDEKGMDTPEARGAAISRAIAKQVEMVRKVQPDAPIITNLWMEGAALYHAGHIKLPEGVTIVWPDDGSGLIRDEGRVQAGQGIYYHTAMLSGRHNQLSEMVMPGRIYNEVGRFIRAGATEFFLVNISDVRPVPLSTDCAMRLVRDARPYLDRSDQENQDAFYADWCRRQYGPEIGPQAAPIYAKYFNTPYFRRDSRTGDNYIHRRLQLMEGMAEEPVVSGKPLDEKIMGNVKNQFEFVAKSRPWMAETAAQAEALAPLIPAARQPFFRGHLLTQARVHLHSLDALEANSRALEAYAKGDKPEAVAQAEKSLKALDELFAELHAAEYGKWAGWYHGEGFVGLDNSRDRARALLAALRGEPLPPRRSRRTYEVLYQYQEPFQENFPLLYPPKQGKP